MNSSAGPCTHRPTYPKINVPAHFDPFLQANHEDLPVDSTARPHTHRWNRFSFYLFILKLSFRQTTNTDLSTHLLYYISAPTPSLTPVHRSTKFRLARQLICWSAYPHAHLMFFFQVSMNTNPCHLLPVPPSAGLYTRFIFCSMHTQAYSKLSLPLHYDAFLPAKQSDLPVDSTTRLHAHRGTCSSAYQFFFPFCLTCALT